MSATRYLASLVALAATAALLTGASLARADGITSEQAQDIINELKQIRQTLEKMQSPQAAPAPDDKVSYKFSPGGFSMGDAKAPLVLVEYTDLQCPFCQQFDNAEALKADNLASYAGTVKLDVPKFKSCLESDKFKAQIDQDVAEGGVAGVQGTPSFVIGRLENDKLQGVRMVGAMPYAQFDDKIQEMLEQAGKK